LTVKLWDPKSNNQALIGQHLDYVKCLTTPCHSSDWLLSGGLDRRIVGWDVKEQKGEKFSIESETEDPKGSIYALGLNKATNPIIGAGGPEAVVRLYDSRSTCQIMKFIGHTDNIRSILISDDGEWVLSGSSDSSIKLWSVTAGRLLHTFDMHDDSIWSLSSEHPTLDVFYSSDRSGIVAKTDIRQCEPSRLNVDDAYSAIVFKDHQGVAKMAHHEGYMWTATSNSWIHRWKDVDLDKLRSERGQEGPTESKLSTMLNSKLSVDEKKKEDEKEEDDDKNTTSFKRLDGTPLDLKTKQESDDLRVAPMYKNPVETLEGHIGIIKHRLLTDKMRVLTLDTSGVVTLWDLLKCVPIQSFGTAHDIDELADQFNVINNSKMSSVSNWCTVTTRTGELYVSLESSTCFDAEVYADELEELEDELKGINFKEDHRINLGKWIIRNLLCNFLTAEIEQDREYRRNKKRSQQQETINSSSASVSTFSTISSDQNNTANTTTNHSSSNDDPNSSSNEIIKSVPIPAATDNTDANSSAANSSTPASSSKGKFMGKLRGLGKSKKDKSTPATVTSSTNGSTTNNSTTAGSSTNNTTTTTVNNLVNDRPDYTMSELIDYLRSKTSSLNNSPFNPPTSEEAPILKIPEGTKLMISEQTPGSGGTVDLYRGTVGSAGKDIEAIDKVIPEWVARVILASEIPTKEAIKVGFTLQPNTPGVDPEIVGGGNLRLTAYQMLRARKIGLYLVDRLGENAGSPESYELICQGKTIPPNMSLAAIRTRFWRSGGDVVIRYRKKD
jgi:WD repeat-containing protein 48